MEGSGRQQTEPGPSPQHELTTGQLYQDFGCVTDTRGLAAHNHHFITRIDSAGQEVGQDTARQLVSAPRCLGPQLETLEDRGTQWLGAEVIWTGLVLAVGQSCSWGRTHMCMWPPCALDFLTEWQLGVVRLSCGSVPPDRLSLEQCAGCITALVRPTLEVR